MDSLTQIVLGAAVGEALMGKEVGKRAPLMGAVIATLPDLDVIGSFFQSELGALITHRSLTHSILFAIIMAPLLGWLVHKKVYKERWGSRKGWSWLAFWALITHTFLDCFTTWGTQLFYPFSSYRVALNNIFVIDPFYTVPFLICLLIAIRLSRTSKWRRFWNWTGILISSFYLILTLTNKLVVEGIFRKPLFDQGISSYEISTYPTPLNNILWYCVAEEFRADTFIVGYHSLLSADRNIDFISIPKNEYLLYDHQENEVIKTLKWVSKEQYSIEEKNGDLIFHDLRFGVMNPFTRLENESWLFAFSYKLLPKGGPFTDIERIESFEPTSEGEKDGFDYLFDKVWPAMWEKIKGN